MKSKRTNSVLLLEKFTPSIDSRLITQQIVERRISNFDGQSTTSTNFYQPPPKKYIRTNHKSLVYIDGKCITPQKNQRSFNPVHENNLISGYAIKQFTQLHISKSLYILNQCFSACIQEFKIFKAVSLNFDQIYITTSGNVDTKRGINQLNSAKRFDNQQQIINFLLESVKKVSDHTFTDFHRYYIRSQSRLKLDLKAMNKFIKSYAQCSKINIVTNIWASNQSALKTQIIAKSSKNSQGKFSDRLKRNSSKISSYKVHRNSSRLFSNESDQNLFKLQKISVNKITRNPSINKKNDLSKSKKTQNPCKIQSQFTMIISDDNNSNVIDSSLDGKIIKKSCCNSSNTKDSLVSNSNFYSSKIDCQSHHRNNFLESSQYAITFSQGNFNAFTPKKANQSPSLSKKAIANFYSVLNNNDLEEVVSQGSSSSEPSEIEFSLTKQRRKTNGFIPQVQQKLYKQVKQNQERILQENNWTRRINTLLTTQSDLQESIISDSCFSQSIPSMSEIRLSNYIHKSRGKQVIQSFIKQPIQKLNRKQQRRYTHNVL